MLRPKCSKRAQQLAQAGSGQPARRTGPSAQTPYKSGAAAQAPEDDPYEFKCSDYSDCEPDRGPADPNSSSAKRGVTLPPSSAPDKRRRTNDLVGPASDLFKPSPPVGSGSGMRAENLLVRKPQMCKWTATGPPPPRQPSPLGVRAGPGADTVGQGAGASAQDASMEPGGPNAPLELDMPPSAEELWLSRVAPPGMPNQGNTCYLNSVLQALFSLPTFTQHLKALETSVPQPAQPSPSPGPAASGGQPQQAAEQQAASTSAASGPVAEQPVYAALPARGLTRALAACLGLIQKAARNNAGPEGARVGSVAPSAVWQALRGTQWKLNFQQDAHELYVALTEQMMAEVLTAQTQMMRTRDGSLARSVSPPVQPQQQQATRVVLTDSAGRPDQASAAPASPCQGHDTGAAQQPIPMLSPAKALHSEQQDELDGSENATPQAQAGSMVAREGPATGAAADDTETEREGDAQEDEAGAVHGADDAGPVAAADPPAVAAPQAPEAAQHTCVPYSAALCPGVRALNGCLRHTFVCQECRHVSHVREQFSHLSLQLPSGDLAASEPTLLQLLHEHLKEEELEKACEACKCPKALHTVTHEFLRLPAVLALHLKRFSFTDTLRAIKLHTRVALPGDFEVVDLGDLCVEDAPAHPALTSYLDEETDRLGGATKLAVRLPREPRSARTARACAAAAVAAAGIVAPVATSQEDVLMASPDGSAGAEEKENAAPSPAGAPRSAAPAAVASPVNFLSHLLHSLAHLPGRKDGAGAGLTAGVGSNAAGQPDSDRGESCGKVGLRGSGTSNSTNATGGSFPGSSGHCEGHTLLLSPDAPPAMLRFGAGSGGSVMACGRVGGLLGGARPPPSDGADAAGNADDGSPESPPAQAPDGTPATGAKYKTLIERMLERNNISPRQSNGRMDGVRPSTTQGAGAASTGTTASAGAGTRPSTLLGVNKKVSKGEGSNTQQPRFFCGKPNNPWVRQSVPCNTKRSIAMRTGGGLQAANRAGASTAPRQAHRQEFKRRSIMRGMRRSADNGGDWDRGEDEVFGDGGSDHEGVGQRGGKDNLPQGWGDDEWGRQQKQRRRGSIGAADQYDSTAPSGPYKSKSNTTKNNSKNSTHHETMVLDHSEEDDNNDEDLQKALQLSLMDHEATAGAPAATPAHAAPEGHGDGDAQFDADLARALAMSLSCQRGDGGGDAEGAAEDAEPAATPRMQPLDDAATSPTTRDGHECAGDEAPATPVTSRGGGVGGGVCGAPDRLLIQPVNSPDGDRGYKGQDYVTDPPVLLGTTGTNTQEPQHEVIDLMSGPDEPDEEEQVRMAIEASTKDMEISKAEQEAIEKAMRKSMMDLDDPNTLPDGTTDNGLAANDDTTVADLLDATAGPSRPASPMAAEVEAALRAGGHHKVTVCEDDEYTAPPSVGLSAPAADAAAGASPRPGGALRAHCANTLPSVPTSTSALGAAGDSTVGGSKGGDGKPGAKAGGFTQIAGPKLADAATYRLHGAVCHQGQSAHSGHYVAYAFQPLPPGGPEAAGCGAHGDVVGGTRWQWWRYDDNDVDPVTPEKARGQISEKGYLVFLVAQPPLAGYGVHA